jgi:amidophosphoribosyltransferase
MCGVFGAFAQKDKLLLEDIYLGLFALQHRGQEAAGVAWIGPDGMLQSFKGMGLVHEALDQKRLSQIAARGAIGHVRYSTSGASIITNAQPLAANYAKGPVAISHNGNITNAEGIRLNLENRGAIFQSTTDTEVIIHLMAHQSHKAPLDALIDALERLNGAYSLAVLFKDALVAARDPWGFRPLVLGRRDDTYYVASESCALDLIRAEVIRNIEPGEVVVINDDGLSSLRIPLKAKRHYFCSFEYVYFARPDSIIDGRCVYIARKEMGRRLAAASPCSRAQLVTDMPDSGTIAATGYADASGLPYERTIVRNRYVGRTFIQPTQKVRELGVQIKLNPMREVIDGKPLVVVDDSIVRGTTVAKVVSMMRKCGAREIHMRISSPPVRFPCYYGIDTPTRQELAAARFASLEDLKSSIEVDSLAYLKESDLVAAIGMPRDELCLACFNGEYLEEGNEGGFEL